MSLGTVELTGCLALKERTAVMRRWICVLVVVLAVVLGGGLLVTAAFRVRHEAALTQCSNNLRVLGLALENYHDIYQAYPTGTVAAKGLPSGKRLSWLVETHPYWGGQTRLLIDHTKAWDAPENVEPREADEDGDVPVGEVTYLHCPLRPTPAAPGGPGLTNYVGVAGLGEDAADRPAGYPGVGLFGHDRKTRREDLKDGAAVTLTLVETAWENGPWTAGGRPTVRGLDSTGRPYLGPGGQFDCGHREGLFALNPPSVTNAAFADGSVRRLRASIRPEVFEALATIAGGETVAAW
jgi:hypothetical protein